MEYTELLAEQRGAHQEVLSIAHKKGNFVVGSRDGLVQLLKLDLRGVLTQMWTCQFANPMVPKTLLYSEDGHEIHAFGLYDGIM